MANSQSPSHRKRGVALHRSTSTNTAANIDSDVVAHPLLILQQTVGNASVARMLANQGADASHIQRDGEFQLTMPELGSSLRQRRPSLLNVPRLRLNMINLRGVTALRPRDPAPPPWLVQTPATDPQSDDKPDNLWSLDFDMDISPQSALGRSLAQQATLEQLLSGEEANGTPLGLRLANTAINVLAATPGGQELRRRLHLENVTITLNPAEGNYGVSATFRFP